MELRMLAAGGQGRSVERATVVRRKSGPGYRLVLCVKTAHGTAAPETSDDIFASPAEARDAAIRDLGLRASDVRWDALLERSATN